MDTKKKLFDISLQKELTCSVFVIDDFYENPDDVRNFALSLNYYKHPYHPGRRTNNYYIREVDEYINTFADYYKPNRLGRENPILTSFQYNLGNESSWYHTDSYHGGFAGIIYLTPDAPETGGTGFFNYENGVKDRTDATLLSDEMTNITNKYNKDNTKWKLNTSIGNIYNRLIIFNGDLYHKSLEYFGNDKNDSRLIQIIFF